MTFTAFCYVIRWSQWQWVWTRKFAKVAQVSPFLAQKKSTARLKRNWGRLVNRCLVDVKNTRMTSPTTCSFSLYFLSVFLKWKPHTVDGNQKSGINSPATGWSFLVVPPVFPMILHKVVAPSKRWLVGNGILTLQPRKGWAHQTATGADADPPTAPHYISSANNNQLTVGETQILQICGRQLGWSGDRSKWC